MALTLRQLLTLYQLPRIGRAKVISMGQYATDTICSDADDLLAFVSDCIQKKVITGVSSSGYCKEDIEIAANKADRIISDASKEQVQIVSFFDENYPDNLRRIVKKQASASIDSPAFLFVKGSLENIRMKKGIAIIGTREPTAEGVKAGEYFAERFASDGLNIISGLAIGCDSSAHRGALNANGITTAFLAHGLDSVFPKENIDLAERILSNNGLLISEYPIGTKATANYFVERDRLQSGLADATLVIQTGVKGGTMHAVNATIENRKPLFAVQYNKSTQNSSLLTNEKVLGNQMLINQTKAAPLSRSTYEGVLETIFGSKSDAETPYYRQVRFDELL